MSRLLQRQEIKRKVQLVTSRVCPLSTPTLARRDRKWGMTDRFTPRRQGGENKWEAWGSELQKTPDRSRVLPLIYPPSPFCRAIKGKTIFSYCFIKHYVALFIAVSPDSYSIPAAAVCTAPDRTEKDHWSSIRWKMELSGSVTPPYRATLHANVCVCVLDKRPNVILSYVLYCLSFHERVVSGYRCVSAPPVCVCMDSTNLLYVSMCTCVCLWVCH